MAIAFPVVAALLRVAAVVVTKVPPNFSPLVPSCDAISTSIAPSVKVTFPVLSIRIFSEAVAESPVAKTKSVELTVAENVY